MVPKSLEGNPLEQIADPFSPDPASPSLFFTYEEDLLFDKSTEYSYARLVSAYYYDECVQVDLVDCLLPSPDPRDTIAAYHDSMEDAIWDERVIRHSESDDEDLFNFSPCSSPFEPIPFASSQSRISRFSRDKALLNSCDSSNVPKDPPYDLHPENDSHSSLCYLAYAESPMDPPFLTSPVSSPTPSLEASFNSSEESLESPSSSPECSSLLAYRINLSTTEAMCGVSISFSLRKDLQEKYDQSHKSLVYVDGEMFEMVTPMAHVDSCWFNKEE